MQTVRWVLVGAFKVEEEFGNRVFDFQIGDNGEERENFIKLKLRFKFDSFS